MSKKPTPVKTSSRICFFLSYYGSLEDAELAAAESKAAGNTYNGGFFHGKPCGREPQFDHYDDKLGNLFAVSS